MTLQVKIIGDNEREFWDQTVANLPHSHPFNAYGWGKVREIDGWTPTYFVAKEGDVVKGMIMVLHKKIPWTGLSIMYAPKGPVCNPSDHETIESIIEEVKKEGRKKRSIFLRIDPNMPEILLKDLTDSFINLGFTHLQNRWSFWNSPRDVYRIDFGAVGSEDELFKALDRDTRRCIRKATKEGLTIVSAESIDELQQFYEIFKNFSIEKKFLSRDYKYQLALWNEFIVKGNGRLFLAVYEEKIIGGLICLMFGGKCVAMHMGTPQKYNKLHSYYAYVWESICWAKKNGCMWYSFRGVGSTPTQERFKRKFNPKFVQLVGYYDLPFKPILYRIFYFLEMYALPKTVWIYKRIIRSISGFRTRLRKFLKFSTHFNYW